uniref:Uncharacterized protein n=1 Tax=Anguilla anguilla TaxID=7936 RepID=A0A0E9PQG5_ANGAN
MMPLTIDDIYPHFLKTNLNIWLQTTLDSIAFKTGQPPCN